MRKLLGILVIALFTTLSYSQVKVDMGDSIITEFHFCLIHPVRDSGIVKLHCSDGNGVTIYMEIREDVFEGKLNILITPSEDLGPITKEKTINWFMLPEEKDE